jgi:multiple sugar transport system ATP-binding protein
MADTIAVINHGKVEQIGTPEEVFNRPNNTFVARFVGDPPMNILATTIEAGSLVVDCDVNFQLPVPETVPGSLYSETHEGKVLIGIRPKDIHFVPENAVGAHTRGRVKDVDTLGQTSIVIATVGCLELKVKVPTSEAPERDSLVNMTLDISQLHYFEASSKTRLV